MRAWIALAVLCAGLTAVLLFAWSRLMPIGVGQPAANRPSPIMGRTATIGQTFRVEHDRLFRVDALMATYLRRPRGRLVFHLRTGPEVMDDLARVEVDAGNVEDNRFFSFAFPAITGRAGQTLFFLLEAPTGGPENPIGVWTSDRNRYLDGAAFFDGRMVEADLTFVAYYQLDAPEALGVLLAGAARRHPATLAIPGFHGALLLADLVGVLALLAILARRASIIRSDED